MICNKGTFYQDINKHFILSHNYIYVCVCPIDKDKQRHWLEKIDWFWLSSTGMSIQ